MIRSAVIFAPVLVWCGCLAAQGDVVLDSFTVPEGFVVERAADSTLASYPMFLTFTEYGDLYVAESTGKDISGKEMAIAPECLILRLQDVDGDGVYDTRQVFADTLSLPMGLLWHQDSLYVASPPDFIRFRDTDGDGVADEREVLLTGWNILNTASLHGPYLGPDGWLYLTHGRHGYKIQSKEGAWLEGMAARIWRCRADGTGLERMAGGGFDNPVELIFTPGGETIGTMTYFTDPRNGERDGLMHWVEGGVYPKPHETIQEFVLTGGLMPTMTKFSRIAPSGLERYRGQAFGPEYEGVLFSAQFNPHRVQMHRLIPDGATYRTEDENFLTSTFPDFFPTDALEDADGSLLLSDTGAWYVDACPISRVAKPEVKGGIYRVRRADAAPVADPWGHTLDWNGMTPEELTALLADNRPRARDRAAVALERHGKAALPALEAFYRSAAAEDARLEAFWVLSRIAGASEAVREGLEDPVPAIAMAAARMTGLEKDHEAAPALTALLRHDHPGVRRQAATALGQLGALSAAEHLLAAASDTSDRFIEHALTYSLIQIGAEDTLAAGLDSPIPAVQRTALVALDQMGSDRLTGELAAKYLDSDSAEVRAAALWIAGHHPAWAPAVLAYMEKQLLAAPFNPDAGLKETILAFAGEGAVQDMIGALLDGEAAGSDARLWLLALLAEVPLKPFPDSLLGPLERMLQEGDRAEWSAAILLLQRHPVDGLDGTLRTLVRDAGEDPALRLQALAAYAPRIEALAPEETALLQEAILNRSAPTHQLTAARLSAAAPWSDAQLDEFSAAYLPAMDMLTVNLVLPLFGRSSSETVGLQLVQRLIALSQEAYINLEGTLPEVLKPYPDSVRAAAMPLFDQWAAEREQRVTRLQRLESKLGTGDVGQGRRIFFGEKSACATCHAIGEEGGRLGPDLTTIGLIRTGHDLLEAILFPNASLVPGFETVRVETLEDEYVGVITSEDARGMNIATGVDQTVYVSTEDVLRIRQHAVSLMPEGLDAALTEEELLDLMTFLQSLNGSQFLLPEVAKN